MFDLSIVLPTCNRAKLLERALTALWSGVQCNYEIIVVNGASDDETPGLLKQAVMAFGERLKVVREPVREGFVRATNKGFRAARGRNLMWLNDDARPLGGALDAAVAQIDAADPSIGFLAMYHRCRATKSIAFERVHRGVTYKLVDVLGTRGAILPGGRRDATERLEYFWVRCYLRGAIADPARKE